MPLRVLSPGFHTTVQDSGRFDFQRFGVTTSGPMDWFALRAANRLVNNPPGAAGLEFALLGPSLLVLEDSLVALGGRGFRLNIQGRGVGAWMAAWVRRGEKIEVQSVGGRWGYLAVAGGIDTPPVLGSRSTYLRAGLGGFEGRSLEEGDELPSAPAEHKLRSLAGRWLPPTRRPAYADEVELGVILGPQQAYFTPEALAGFLTEAYTVTSASDRMGCRLEGAKLTHSGQTELLSEGLPEGSVQVPASGQPVVVMCDHGTTGGYPKIAVVTRACLPLLAQVPTGTGRVRFAEVSLIAAQSAYRELVEGIETGIE